MKKFILRRVMQYTEQKEVLARSFDDAKRLLEDGIELDYGGEDVVYDESIEFVGDC